MYYLIQENVFKNSGYNQIFHVMEDLNLEYECISFQPNSNYFDFKTTRKDVFVYGSVKLARVASNFDWHPGSFHGKNHEFEQYSKGYGKYIINEGSYICKFSEPIDWSTNSNLFIKPSKDAKIFTGKVFNKPEWDDFVYYNLDNRIPASTLIQVSAPYTLIKEARVWIVGKKIITSSYYRFHGDIEFEENLSIEGLAFAQKMANLYNVADAYVLDIVLTYDGWKVVEVNCINSAGFYKGNVKHIITALEAFYS